MISAPPAEDPGAADPLRTLIAITENRRELARAEETAVRRARIEGYSWEAIAMALGISKQAAHRKYGRK